MVAERDARRGRGDQTRAAILDATLERLATHGFAATSTRGIAARLGVSQGAIQYHFKTKVDMVEAALNELLDRIGPRRTAAGDPSDGSEIDEWRAAERLMESLWRVHNLPISRAVIELLSVANSDDSVREKMSDIANRAQEMTLESGRALMPTLSRTPGFDEWLLQAIASMRGQVIISRLVVEGAVSLQWPAHRDILLSQLRAVQVG
ncbi:TetR/AcrR family transcriptional regulator [Gordonia sp. OPL2]|uniref:TetR/AcrR family transcriptional regulator n=1 Tax=Gordonia sp. OPL2 TaxID=2486274 RepID=UPI0016556EE5|nr:TetR/AcrR family transcriptional regulator [Gordonia sp. OPL2]ROZ99316.1 TetR/AcrR family transcriptional regulator [Gordonia sp. OPL2]